MKKMERQGYEIRVFLPVAVEDRENAQELAEQVKSKASNATGFEFEAVWVTNQAARIEEDTRELDDHCGCDEGTRLAVDCPEHYGGGGY